ncbi:hypothetical protein BD626DRAFT_564649 [Schizophyllum amplum]|uniref:Uncharacterized protein n=1 Tax=Schizophyllum amplum TaxID=97359 RepID=A0A550CSG9_9AGAR|nr:hypothetical protein BD626DRAFT_564649 [Auriculariopsis ampla]
MSIVLTPATPKRTRSSHEHERSAYTQVVGDRDSTEVPFQMRSQSLELRTTL